MYNIIILKPLVIWMNSLKGMKAINENLKSWQTSFKVSVTVVPFLVYLGSESKKQKDQLQDTLPLPGFRSPRV